MTRVTLCKPRATSGRTTIPVDSCIAPLVQALNDAEIETTGSCCGHGEADGLISLADGRVLNLGVAVLHHIAVEVDNGRVWMIKHAESRNAPRKGPTKEE